MYQCSECKSVNDKLKNMSMKKAVEILTEQVSGCCVSNMDNVDMNDISSCCIDDYLIIKFLEPLVPKSKKDKAAMKEETW
jgi:hypothetical protein